MLDFGFSWLSQQEANGQRKATQLYTEVLSPGEATEVAIWRIIVGSVNPGIFHYLA